MILETKIWDTFFETHSRFLKFCLFICYEWDFKSCIGFRFEQNEVCKNRKNNTCPFFVLELKNYHKPNEEVLDNERTKWRLQSAFFVSNNASNRLTRGLKLICLFWYSQFQKIYTNMKSDYQNQIQTKILNLFGNRLCCLTFPEKLNGKIHSNFVHKEV